MVYVYTRRAAWKPDQFVLCITTFEEPIHSTRVFWTKSQPSLTRLPVRLGGLMDTYACIDSHHTIEGRPP